MSRLNLFVAFFLMTGLATGWISSVYFDALSHGNLRRVGTSVTDGEVFRQGSLDAAAGRIRDQTFSGCFPDTTRAAAMILFAQSDAKMKQGDSEAASVDRAFLRSLTLQTLSCAPARGYDWLIMLWYSFVVNGDLEFGTRMASMLFHIAPYEGWLITRRLPLLASFGPAFNSTVRERISRDFHLILSERHFETAAKIYNRSPSLMRDLFREKVLLALKQEDREAFVKQLQQIGDDVPLPGVRLNSQPRYFR